MVAGRDDFCSCNPNRPVCVVKTYLLADFSGCILYALAILLGMLHNIVYYSLKFLFGRVGYQRYPVGYLIKYVLSHILSPLVFYYILIRLLRRCDAAVGVLGEVNPYL